MRWLLCPRGWGGISLGGGRGVARGVREAPPVRSRTAGPSGPTRSGRAQTQRTESLRRPPIIAASSRCISPRPDLPRDRGPACPTHRGGLSTRSCGSEASSFSPTAPRIHPSMGPEWMRWAQGGPHPLGLPVNREEESPTTMTPSWKLYFLYIHPFLGEPPLRS